MPGIDETLGKRSSHESEHDSADGASGRLKRPVQPALSGKPRQRTLRFRLACLVLACVLPVCAIAGFVVYHAYQQKRNLLEQSLLDTARALSTAVDRELAAMQASLAALATSPSAISGNAAALDKQARAVLHDYPAGSVITLSDASGRQLADTFVPLGTPLPRIAGWAQAKKVFETGKPVIINLYKGVLTKRFIIGIAVPVFRDGRVAYSLMMTVPANHFEAMLSEQRVPKDWPTSVLDTNRVLVAQNRPAERYIGLRTIPLLFEKLGDEDTEGIVDTIGREGRPMLAIFSRSPRTGWAVSVGVPKAVVLAGLRQWLWWTVGGAILLLMTGIALALFLARRIAGSIQALSASALALGAGEPVGIGQLDLAEANEVGQSLVKASQLLQQRTAERDKADEAIRTSRQQLQAIIDGATETVVFVKDVDGRFITVNSRFEKLLGITRDDVRGKTDYDIVTKERAEYYRAHDRMALATGQPMQIEEVALLADGKEHIFLANKFPLVDASGKPYAVCSISADITERKQADSVLQTTLHRFYVILASMYSAVLLVPDEGRVEFANQAFCDCFGLEDTPAELAGLCSSDTIEKIKNGYRYPDEAVARIQEVLDRGQPVMGEELAMRSGRTFLRDFIPLNIDGKSYGRLWLHTDITERKQTEEALRESEERLRLLGDNLPDSAVYQYVHEPDGRVRFLHFSAGVERLNGVSVQDVLRDTGELHRQVPPEYLARLVEAEAKSARDLSDFDMEVPMHRPDGPVRWMRLHSRPRRMPDGRVVWDGVQTDVTEHKRAEEALLRSEKLASVGRMAATIAHEINNPLEAVMSLLFLAKDSKELSESTRQYLEIADGELKRIAHITRQSLGFYRESNAPALMSVNALLESAVDLLKSRIKAKQAVIEKQWDGDVQLTAVAGELRQVFSNLLSNSLDAIDEKGMIKLRVSTGAGFTNGDRRVRITVADNGKGIGASARQRIFEPFFTTKGTVGTGLGLWVSKQIVDKHSGTIRVRSSTNEARRGTAFSVVLPVEPAAAARSQSAGA